MRRTSSLIAMALTLGCSSATNTGAEDATTLADAGSEMSDTSVVFDDASVKADSSLETPDSSDDLGDAARPVDSMGNDTSGGGVADSAADTLVVDSAADTLVVDSAADTLVVDSAADTLVVDSAADTLVVDSAADTLVVDSAKCPIPAARYVGEDACGPPCVLAADTSCDGHAREIRCYRGSACFSAYTCGCYLDGASTGVSFGLASGYCTLSAASMWSSCGFP